MDQALRAARACLGALSPEDHVGLVAFDTEVISSGPSLLAGTAAGREEALRFLEQVTARGGTELLLGLREAFRLLSSGGDVFLLTDGQVSATEEIISAAKGAGVRIHCLGIGSASQDRFLSLLAAETGGTGRMVTPRERVDLAALELFASVGRPVASDLSAEIHGLADAKLVPAPASTVFGGHPVVLFGSAEGGEDGRVELSWTADGGRRSTEIPLAIASSPLGNVLRLLQGAKQLSSVEAQYVGPDRAGAADGRRQDRLRRLLTRLSEEYGLASRTMALVAVVQRPGDRAGDVPRTRVVPVGMPQDTAFESYFGPADMAVNGCSMAPPPSLLRKARRTQVSYASAAEAVLPPQARERVEASTDEVLLELAGRLEPDGGLPGRDDEERVAASLLLLLLCAAEGHSPDRGPFRQHVRRLLDFLKGFDTSQLDERQHDMIGRAVALLEAGECLDGLWLPPARKYLRQGSVEAESVWAAVEEALAAR